MANVFAMTASLPCLIILMATVVLGQRDTPPIISDPQGNKWQEPLHYIRPGSHNAVNFTCKAKAFPAATYKWTVNGEEVSTSDTRKVWYSKVTGTLTTGESFNTLDNDGDYQCIASNSQGTAMTPYLKLLATRGDTFPGGVQEVVQAYASQYLKLECKKIPLSVPQWEFNWEKEPMGNSENVGKIIVRDSRMSVDPQGNLHFLWVEQTDDNFAYRCTGYNSVMKLEVKNTNTYLLRLLAPGSKPDQVPVLRYHSDVVAMVGSTARLTCIFSYFSNAGEKLVIDWYKQGAKMNNANNTQYEGRALMIFNVKSVEGGQSGEYRCEAKIGNKPVNLASQGTVNLKITSPPEFIKGMAPVATYVPVGKDAVFKCSTVSHNAYKKPTTWFINGLPLLGCPPLMFECTRKETNGSSKCILERLRCNNDPDCVDGSDELNCGTGPCREGQKECNGNCVAMMEICEKQMCFYPNFQCYYDAKCLPVASVCNGIKNCADGSDELSCPNTQPIKINRYIINAEQTELRLPTVSMSDTMCVQCMVSNTNGHLIGDGCMTVIGKISIVTPLNDTYHVYPGMELNISVDAITDILFQYHMLFEWTWHRKVKNPNMNVEYEEPVLLPTPLDNVQFRVSQNGKKFKIIIPKVENTADETYQAYMDLANRVRFSLNISHKYDYLIHSITVVGTVIGPPPGDTPPIISDPQGNKWQEPLHYIRPGSNNVVNFTCKAKAFPAATYKWTVNGEEVSTSDTRKVWYSKVTGTLTTGESFNTLDNDGDYQCIASNSQGTAMTPYLKLLATRGDTFPGGVQEVVQAYASQYLKLECKKIPLSVPQWEFNWEKEPMGNSENVGKIIVRDSRMSVDPQGNLHFLWVEQTDDNFAYRCTGYNSVMKLEVKNTNTYLLRLLAPGSKPDQDPVLRYHSDVVAMVGSTARLTCIFSYFSNAGEKLVIDWYKQGAKMNNANNTQYEGRALMIFNVKSVEGGQSGEYSCEAKIGNKPANLASQGTVNLKITSPPEFIKGMAPVATYVPVGKDAVFKCSTISHNAYKKPTTWFINGLPLLGCPPFMFECTRKETNGSSKCILERLRCNNDPDCVDGSDELNCGTGPCREGQKECNGNCVAMMEICEKQMCFYPNFQCYYDAKCLPVASVCNGIKNCADGSDELSCPNTQPIKINRYIINAEQTELRLPTVSMSDTMCVQCMVSNTNGHLIGDGCMTVIGKISIVTPLNDTYHVYPGMELNISVDAITDILFQYHMLFEWTWHRKVKNPNMNVEYEEPVLLPTPLHNVQFRVSQNGKEFKIIIPKVENTADETYQAYMDLANRVRFSLNISHKYDYLIHSITVVGTEIGPPPVNVPVVETNFWYIAIILAVIILIVVLLIVCYMYRKRGGTYPCTDRTRISGHRSCRNQIEINADMVPKAIYSEIDSVVPKYELIDKTFNKKSTPENDYDDLLGRQVAPIAYNEHVYCVTNPDASQVQTTACNNDN